MQKRITTHDIARLANVSPSTVSRSLNNSPLVAEETRRRVREIAARGNFSFNSSARSLITNKTGIIGLIAPDSYNEYQYSLHTALLINKVRAILEHSELDLIVKLRVDANGRNSLRTLTDSQKVDGLLVINPDITREELDYAAEQGYPLVLLQAIPPNLDLSGTDHVFADHVSGGLMATDHLLAMGHRSIACFTIDTHEASFSERTQGYRQALRQVGVEHELIASGDGTFEFGYQYVRQNARRFGREITAIFSHTDIMALGAIEGLWDIGLRVPGDVSVVAYDDIGFGKDFRPRLTTVHQPRDRIAAIACDRIVSLRAADRPSSEAERRDAKRAEEQHDAHRGGGHPDGAKPEFTDNTQKPVQSRVQPYLVVRESCGAE